MFFDISFSCDRFEIFEIVAGNNKFLWDAIDLFGLDSVVFVALSIFSGISYSMVCLFVYVNLFTVANGSILGNNMVIFTIVISILSARGTTGSVISVAIILFNIFLGFELINFQLFPITSEA